MKRCIAMTAAGLMLVLAGCADDDNGDASLPDEGSGEVAAEGEPETTTGIETQLERHDDELAPPVLYEGSGDSVIEIELPTPTATVATVTHSGASNFAVWELDSNFEQASLAVNEIGAYDGVVLMNHDPFGGLDSDGGTVALEITADGPWSVELAVIGHLDLTDLDEGSIEGAGDDVVFLMPTAARTVTLHHAGESNFAIWLHPIVGRSDLLLNDIGPYDGMVPLRAEVGGLLEITADGPWSITAAS